MALEFEFLSPTDKPALLGLSNPSLVEPTRQALTEMEYKVHLAANHENFLERFAQIQYQIVVLEENFGGVSPDQNTALKTIQTMAMALRRHATFVLFGGAFKTLAPMQAYQQSVHAVINQADAGQIKQILMQVSNDNTLFLSAFRDVQGRFAQGKK